MISINISGQSGKKYRVKKKSFLEKLFSSRETAINALCSVLFIISAAVTIIFCMNAFFHRIYSKQEAYINSAGAIVNTMNNKEVTLWLYSPSQIMEDSGIRVSKGDKIKISASGSYHSGLQDKPLKIIETSDSIVVNSSSFVIPEKNKTFLDKLRKRLNLKENAPDTSIVHGIVYAARENIPPTYGWVPQYNQKRSLGDHGKFRSAINRNVNYGTLLVGIMDEFNNPMDRQGLLDFSELKEHLEPAYRYRRWTKVKNDGVLHFIINDSAYFSTFYDDNLGETLVSVEIRYKPKNIWILVLSILVMLGCGTFPFLLQYFKSEKGHEFIRKCKSIIHRKHES